MDSKRYGRWRWVWGVSIGITLATIMVEAFFIPAVSLFTISMGNLMWDLFLIIILIPALSVVGYLAGAYLLSPLMLFIQKRVTGRRFVYGVEIKPKPARFTNTFSKAFLPALVTIHFGILLSGTRSIQEIIIVPAVLSVMAPVFSQILTFTAILPVISAVSMFIYAGSYTLLDCGFIFSNKELDDVNYDTCPVEVRSVGRLYLDTLNGYAGISVILDFVMLILPYLFQLSTYEPIIFLLNLSWPLMPLMIAFITVPAIILRDIKMVPLRKYMTSIAKKLGISGDIEDPLGRERR